MEREWDGGRERGERGCGWEGVEREGVWKAAGQHMYEQKTICCALGLRMSILVGRHNIMIV